MPALLTKGRTSRKTQGILLPGLKGWYPNHVILATGRVVAIVRVRDSLGKMYEAGVIAEFEEGFRFKNFERTSAGIR